MEEKDILAEEEGGILRIVLNRPRVRNALTTSMMDKMPSAWKAGKILRSPVVIFSGRGFLLLGLGFRQLQPGPGGRNIRRHLQAIANMYKALRRTPNS